MLAQPQNRNPIRPLEDGRRPDTEPAVAPAPAGPRPGIDQIKDILQHAYEVLYRRRRVFAVVAGALGGLLSLILLLQSPLYEASSLVLVKFGRELVYQTEVGADQTVTSRNKETMINSEVAILHSRPVLEQVAVTVGLPSLYPDLAEMSAEVDADTAGPPEERERAKKLLMAQAAERLGESVSALALPDADVLSISFQHPDPLVAEATIKELVNRYLEAHLEAYGEPGIATFLDRRVSDYEARLDASEKQLQEFETQHAAFALESPQTTLMQWRDETLKELTEVENRITAIRARHSEDAAVAEARNALMNLQLEQEQLEGNLKRDAADRIDVVQRFIASRRADGEREVYVFEQKKKALTAKLEQTEQELTELPNLSAQYRSLRRERDADEEQYGLYRRRLRDARMSNDMDREKIASISIIQPASTTPEPVWPPSKAASLPIALVLSLVAGGLAAVLADRLGGTGIRWLDEGSEPV